MPDDEAALGGQPGRPSGPRGLGAPAEQAEAPTAPPAAPGPGPGGPQLSPAFDQLAGQLTDRVVGVVDWLRAKATLRVTTALALAVYGFVALVGLVAALVLLVVAVVRIWDVYVPVQPEGRRVWLAYIVFGGLLFLAGAWLWARARGNGRG